jgi:2-polyprenyl-3-methyl-5-hydroxy-6-metoxy-1,4-benzoquinol methylase
MKPQLKAMAKNILPPSVVHGLRHVVKNLPRSIERLRTERIFTEASLSPSHLSNNTLEQLQQKYPFPPKYGWDPDTLEVRGEARSAELLRFPGGQQSKTFLELGCWDGMVSCALAKSGKQTTAIDYRDIGFDERARRGGVKLMQMNAADLRFDAESFDFVFSYDALEHVASPEEVLREAVRVTRPGGYIYLDFGPLYYSPFGEHAYDSIPVPYCQFLFSEKQINDFAARKKMPQIDFSHVNRWSLKRYRELWEKFSPVLKKLSYYESLDYSHLDLIREYPSCFRSKSDYFEDFQVDYIKVLFQKIA